MPYKDPAKAAASAKIRTDRARARRLVDPEFAAKERLACAKYTNNKYHTDPAYRTNKNRKRVTARYGMSLKEYATMLAAQGNSCAICKTPHFDENHKRLAIDHNHTLEHMAIRGLLCTACNVGLGTFKDSPTILRAAAAYLERTT